MTPDDDDLIDLVPCGLLKIRRDGVIEQVNETFCAWTGHRADELVGHKRLRDLLTAGARIFYHTHWQPLLHMQGSISEVKLDVLMRDGQSVPMVINALMHGEGDEAFQTVATFVARDRDQYERELVKAKKRLRESVDEAQRLHEVATDRALLAEQMIGIVSHDLRNPLGTLRMGTDLLRRTELTDAQQVVVTRMRRVTERATRLLADLLDFTQARLAGGLSVYVATCDLHEAVAHTLDELRVLYPGRELRHHREAEGTCQADETRLAQLLGNLVSNAVAYGAPESPITVTSAVGAERCALTVHNDGDPIPEAVQETIFSPMERATPSPSSARSIGLGLYIVKMIAAAHGGDVRVESTEATGTTFIVTFPTDRDAAANSDHEPDG